LAEKKRAEAARIAEEKRRKVAEAAKTNENKVAGNKAENKVVEPPAPKPVNLNVTPETKELSDQFEGNKGRLPWPVEKGTISGGFGITAHPYLKGVTIKNDGVDISTSQGAEVRAVFKGKVSGVFAVQGYGKVIILRHGEYLTVYSNLAEVAVSKDASVSLKQKLGRVETSDNGKTFINFQIRKGSLTLNPQSWLAAM
jgi:septal ring factor EnvC (AmiA/AmiB activator)